jgi:hypothetical protein
MKFCEMNCRYADWPKEKGLDGSASCRTFQAIFCEKMGMVVYKNAPCPEKENRPRIRVKSPHPPDID